MPGAIRGKSQFIGFLQASEQCCEWAIENLYRQGDELLFFHVIPVPMPQVVGGGMGGDFVFIDPDPMDDIRHVRPPALPSPRLHSLVSCHQQSVQSSKARKYAVEAAADRNVQNALLAAKSGLQEYFCLMKYVRDLRNMQDAP